MSGDTFRNRIAEVAWASRPRPGGAAYQHGGMSTADAILAMSEMEAIKVVLWHHYAHWDGSNPRPEDMMPDLPESVINWVLGGPS